MRAAARAALAAALGAGGEGGGGTLDADEGLNAGLDVGRANTGKAEAGGTAAALLGQGRRGRPSESPEKKQKVQNHRRSLEVDLLRKGHLPSVRDRGGHPQYLAMT